MLWSCYFNPLLLLFNFCFAFRDLLRIIQRMARSLTFAEARERFSNLVTTEVDISDAIQEVVDRAYEMGRWRGMTEEVECGTHASATYREDTEKEEVYVDFDPQEFDGAIGFRYKHSGWYIKTLISLYQEENYVGNSYFIDLGDVLVDGETVRRYRMPKGWKLPTEPLYALMKKVAVNPLQDESIIPINSVGALKAGILAVAYENVNDLARSEAQWQKFTQLMERAQKQYNGNRKFHVRINDNLKKRPTQFT